MVWIPGGTFLRGSDNPKMPEARPRHRVTVDGFYMDRDAVTNAEFKRFVDATGYVTVAEKTPLAKDFPGLPPENLVAGSVVFHPPAGPVPLNNHLQWWTYLKGASWRHPEGPKATSKAASNIPWSRWPGTMQLPTASGPASVCRRRPSSSLPPGAGWKTKFTFGATSSSHRGSGWPTSGKDTFPVRELG